VVACEAVCKPVGPAPVEYVENVPISVNGYLLIHSVIVIARVGGLQTEKKSLLYNLCDDLTTAAAFISM
jgi:hypothetical protein